MITRDPAKGDVVPDEGALTSVGYIAYGVERIGRQAESNDDRAHRGHSGSLIEFGGARGGAGGVR